MGLFDSRLQHYREELEKAHAQFLSTPTEEAGWQLAAAVESFLEMLDVGT